METITIDGMDEDDFRHSVEDMLRLDQLDEAIERLRDLVAPYAGEGRILPPRFLDVSFADVELAGWHRLADRLCDHDRPNHPISAIGVTLADARVLGGPGPSGGRLAPFIKTFYFSDEAYPFSDATRDDLLDGYSRDGFEWQGDYQATDATLSIKGIDDLYGAVVELEDRLFGDPNPAGDEIRAGTIGACYLAALIHRSLRETIRTEGLPRPLCVLAACDGVYPFFDAPVAGSDECAAENSAGTNHDGVRPTDFEGASLEDEDEFDEDTSGEASLLSLVSHKGTKRPVIVLAEEDAREAARFTEMASAQRLAPDDQQAQHELLEAAHAAELADAAALGAGQAWNEPEPREHREALEEPVAFATEPRRDPLSGFGVPGDAKDGSKDFPDMPPSPAVSDDQDYLDEDDRAVAEISASPDLPDAFRDLLDESLATEPESADWLAAPPARHSLRARINLAEPASNDTSRNRTGTFTTWFKRLIFRR